MKTRRIFSYALGAAACILLGIALFGSVAFAFDFIITGSPAEVARHWQFIDDYHLGVRYMAVWFILCLAMIVYSVVYGE